TDTSLSRNPYWYSESSGSSFATTNPSLDKPKLIRHKQRNRKVPAGRRLKPSLMGLFHTLLQGLPGQRRTLDPRRKLGDTLERFDILQGKLLRVHLFPLHHRREKVRQTQGLLEAQPLDRFRHHRGRCLADGAALPEKLRFFDLAVLHPQLKGNPVTAGGIVHVDGHRVVLDS